jgi:hypothetical protein
VTRTRKASVAPIVCAAALVAIVWFCLWLYVVSLLGQAEDPVHPDTPVPHFLRTACAVGQFPTCYIFSWHLLRHQFSESNAVGIEFLCVLANGFFWGTLSCWIAQRTSDSLRLRAGHEGSDNRSPGQR